MTPIFTPLPIALDPALLGDFLHLAHAALHRALHRWRQRRDARATMQSLAQLDNRTLHDLGLHPSEISSLSAELGGLARVERRLAVQPATAGSDRGGQPS